jgi:hypothetical protein
MHESTTKSELLELVNAEHARMEQLLSRLSAAELSAPVLDEQWSVKDSLAHLVAWEKLMLGWVESSLRGETVVRFTPEFLETPDTGDAVMLALNEHLHRQDRDRTLEDVLSDFRRTHDQVVASLSRLSEADIFDPGRFAWRQGVPLEVVIAGNTYGHYAEHHGWITTGLARHAAAKAAAAFTPAEVAAMLQATLAAVTSVVGALPDVVASWRPATGEWCVKETLGHLIETEQRSFAGRIRAILANPEPQFADWDPDAVGRARNDHERDLRALLAEFTALRTAGVALIGSLQPDDLRRGGHHPQVGYLRVDELMQEWVYHDCDHVRQMLANIQGYVWPALGENIQKFYK